MSSRVRRRVRKEGSVEQHEERVGTVTDDPKKITRAAEEPKSPEGSSVGSFWLTRIVMLRFIAFIYCEFFSFLFPLLVSTFIRYCLSLAFHTSFYMVLISPLSL